MFPEMVYTLWRATLIVALIGFVPLAVYSLFILIRAARSIERYALEAVAPAQAIAAHTAAVAALDATIAAATEILDAAGGVAGKLDAMAGVIERRASGSR